ncbi:type II toxin-antitoxin system RelE family toxin [Methanobrevibacter filiformis]|uniref:Plasmid stabilization system protein n=1 Tax=Methanobrevibacter filiformis TaxID=55758 RepID=A0A162F9I5_9EURY|nr:type II toxin-antitoxin system RelE/ParE family toxin [Methanobrevibacter filiformis]KZX09875.1 hypothetical protein MBFIL_19500 [Methanobrevibacter filiformis]
MDKKLNKDKTVGELLLKGLNEIKRNPHDSEFLKFHYKGLRKKRKGNYRIIFKISDDEKTVIVTKIGKRDKVYNINIIF